jgi:hypothetical protein
MCLIFQNCLDKCHDLLPPKIVYFCPITFVRSTLILIDFRQDDIQYFIMASLLQPRRLEFFDQLPECLLAISGWRLANGSMEGWKGGRMEGWKAEALEPFASLRAGSWNVAFTL